MLGDDGRTIAEAHYGSCGPFSVQSGDSCTLNPSSLFLLTLFGYKLVALVLFHCNNDISNEDDIRRERGRCTGPRRVPCVDFSPRCFLIVLVYGPRNMVFKVRKYMPIGPPTMAAVKPSSLKMTALVSVELLSAHARSSCCISDIQTHAGTAGVMFDFSEALGVRSLLSSFSRRFFSLDTILRLVIACY